MTSNANDLARELADIQRRLEATERANSLNRASVNIDGSAVKVAEGIRAGLAAGVVAADAIAAASTAAAKADGKVQVFYTNIQPQQASLGDFWVNGDLTTQFNGFTWQPLKSAATEEALEAAASAQAAADGKITTYFMAVPPLGAGTGDLWFDTDDRNILRRWDGTEWVLARDAGVEIAIETAETAQGTAEEAVQQADTALDQATTATAIANSKNKVTYSSTVPTVNGTRVGDLWYRVENIPGSPGSVVGMWEWGGTAWNSRTLNTAVIGSITAGKILTGSLAANTRIIAGPETGTHAELTATGFRVYGKEEGSTTPPTEVLRLGTDTDDYFGVTNAAGQLVASIDNNGSGRFREMSVEKEPEISAADFTGKGGRLYEILDRRARGLAGWTSRSAPAPAPSSTPVSIVELQFQAHANRIYRVSSSAMRVSSSAAGDVTEVQLRPTYGTATTADAPVIETPAPTVNTPISARVTVQHPMPGVPQNAAVSTLMALTGDSNVFANVRVLLTYSHIIGTGTAQINSSVVEPIQLLAEDIGPYTPFLRTAEGASATRRTLVTEAAWIQNWDGNLVYNSGQFSQGSRLNPSGSGQQVQGYGLVGFPDLTGSLTGGTIESVSIFLYAATWAQPQGGTASIGVHNALNAPPGTQAGWDALTRTEDAVRSPGWPRPGGRWVDISSVNKQAWATGEIRGVMVGAAGLGLLPEFFGAFVGTDPDSTRRPRLQIVYTK